MGKLLVSVEFKRRLTAARPRLYRTAFVWTKSRELADDLVQETATKALRKAKQLRDIDALDAWLFRIMMNCWRDYLRQNPSTEDIDNHEISTENTPETDNSRSELIRLVRSAVGQLPDAFRQTVTLVDLEGFSYVETAEILNVPVGTVMSRLSRARSRLRDRLANELTKPIDLGYPLRRVK